MTTTVAKTSAPSRAVASPPARPKRPGMSPTALKRLLTPYVFVSPAMLLLIAFGIFPILVAAVVSLTNMNISGLANWSNISFVGIDNYIRLFDDKDFWQALGNTGFFAIVGVPMIVVVSLSVALLLNRSSSRVLPGAALVLLHSGDHRDRRDLAHLGLPLQHPVRALQLPALTRRSAAGAVVVRPRAREVLGRTRRGLARHGPQHHHLPRGAAGGAQGVPRGGLARRRRASGARPSRLLFRCCGSPSSSCR